MAFTDYISVWIVLFLIFFNGGAVLLEDSGAADYLGIDTELGAEGDNLESTKQDVQDYDTGTGQGATLFGTYNRVAGVLNSVFNSIMPGAAMLKNAGVPVDIVNFVFGGLGIIPPIELAYFLRSG